MNRLTFKSVNPLTNEEQYYPKSVQDKDNEKIIDLTMQSKCNDKLGQYEDIDEEIGIDYIIFNKLRKANKIYYLNDNNEIIEAEVYFIDIMNCYIGAIIKSHYVHSWPFKDYGKNFALTEEELQNEK